MSAFPCFSCVAWASRGLLCLGFLLVGGGLLQAQAPTTKSYDVTPGQLSQADIERAFVSPERLPTPPGALKRSAAEIRNLVEQMSSGYRSLCCPHLAMDITTCHCHKPQSFMLEFLVTLGYARADIDRYMVNGGPSEYRDAYRRWLVREKLVPEVELQNYFGLIVQGPQGNEMVGWDNGWGERLRQMPRTITSYLLVAGAVIVCIVIFVLALRVMSRRNKAQQAGSTMPPKPDLTAIRRDMQALDDA